MTPTIEEVAGWLREAADNIEQEIAPLLGRVLSGPYTKKLRERASQVEAMGWRPIEEAPKDGTKILVCYWDPNCPNWYTPCTASWQVYHPNAKGKPDFRDNSGRKVPSTHFMPMPQPPVMK